MFTSRPLVVILQQKPLGALSLYSIDGNLGLAENKHQLNMAFQGPKMILRTSKCTGALRSVEPSRYSRLHVGEDDAPAH
jgi:hypothetical protein